VGGACHVAEKTREDYLGDAVGAGVEVKSFMAFWRVYLKPQAVGMMTMIHATAMRMGEDFFTVVSAMDCSWIAAGG
jgi:hypothetical protein